MCEVFFLCVDSQENGSAPLMFLFPITADTQANPIPRDRKPAAFATSSTLRNRLSHNDTPPAAREHAPARAPDASIINAEAPSCLSSTDCQGFHFLKNCKKTSDIRKKELLRAFQDARCSKGSIRSSQHLMFRAIPSPRLMEALSQETVVTPLLWQTQSQ